MITKDNYFEKVKKINYAELPHDLKEAYDYTEEITEDHSSWRFYNADEAIKDVVDDYFSRLSIHLEKVNHKTDNAKSSPTEAEAREAAKGLIRGYVERGDSIESIQAGKTGRHGDDFSASIQGNKIHVTEVKGKKVDFTFTLHSIYNELKGSVRPAKERAKPTSRPETKPHRETKKPKDVERIDEEVRFIKRYALMHGKVKMKEQILNFVNSLQRAILERRIRKTSPFAKEIQYIQTNMVKLFNVMKEDVQFMVNKAVLDRFLEIGNSEKIRLSIAFLKRYIGIQGKTLTKEKARRLINAMKHAVKQGKIDSNDPYAERLNNAFESLYEFLEKAQPTDTLEVHPGILNGINEALGCACQDEKGLNGIATMEAVPSRMQNTVMNSMDFSELQFDTLGFTGKWKNLIGDPCPGFTAMVFGKPKMGKSYFCVDWAGYLARHHGNTLYVAREEKLDATLQKKLNDKNVKHPCLDVSDHLPENLSRYQFVFLDSVNKLGLSPQDLERLKIENPGKSFIDIHQTTKEGKFRGTNEYQHDVDVVVELPERGKAVQFGRFNQGGEMEVFNVPDEYQYRQAA